MADSFITRQALASSLKALLLVKPLAKISIRDICDGCSMNRKSFYYHFHDKYELIIWIFETEFMNRAKQTSYASAWEFLQEMCVYFEKNRVYYRRVLEISGQNSLDEYLRNLVRPSVMQLLPHFSEDDPRLCFYVHYFSDAFLCAIRRWLNQPQPLDARRFVQLIRTCMDGSFGPI